jgi:predicted HTH domain antitoxin
MTEITVRIPSTTQIEPWEVQMILAANLFEMGKLSAGQAAETVGLSKRSFIEMLGKYNVSLFGYSLDEIKRDLANL